MNPDSEMVRMAEILKTVVEQQMLLQQKLAQRDTHDQALIGMIKNLSSEIRQVREIQQGIVSVPVISLPRQARHSFSNPQTDEQNNDDLPTQRIRSNARTRSSTNIEPPKNRARINKKSTLQMPLFRFAQRKQEKTQFFLPASEQQRTTVICSLDSYHLRANAEYDEIRDVLEIWVGDLYYKVSELIYVLLDSQELTKEEMKIQFSKNLILNCVCLFDEIESRFKDVWKENKERFIEVITVFAKKSLNFLMRKYPIKYSIVCVHSSLERKILEFDNIKNPQNNSMSLADISFNFKPDGKYDTDAKNLLNFYLKCCKKNFQKFQCQLRCLFNISTSQVDDIGGFNRASRGSTTNDAMKKTNVETMRSGYGLTLATDNSPRREIKHKIGMKFSPDATGYTFQELKEQGISIKSSQVLRILIKWIQNLQKKLKLFSEGKSEELILPHKTLRNRKVTLTQKQIANLKKAATDTLSQVALSTQDSEVRVALSQVHDCIKRNKYNFKYIPQQQVIVGLATAIVSDPVNKAIVGYLSSLLHCILLIQETFNETLRENKVSLMSFGLYDLLRARCSGSSSEIGLVYSRLVDSEVFEIIRVKNRMDTVTRDFLLNLKLKGTPLICELQLVVISEESLKEDKQKSLFHLSHFLYELQRSKFGPLVEACIVSSYLNPTIRYFETQIKSLRLNTLDFLITYSKNDKTIKVMNYGAFKSRKSFSCNNCWQFVDSGQSFIPSFEETRKYYPRRICYNCIMDRIDQPDRKLYLTGDLAPMLVQIKQSDLDNIPDSIMMYIFAIRHGADRNGEVFRLFNHQKINYPKYIRSFIPYPNKIVEKSDCKFKYLFKFVQTLKIYIDCKQVLPSDILPNNKVDLDKIRQSDSQIQTLQVKNQERLLVDNMNESDQSRMIGQIQLIEFLKYDMSKSNDNKNFMEKRFQFLENPRLKLVEMKLLYVDFLMFSQLENLDVSMNRLQEINFKTLKLERLQQINLSCNELVHLDLSGCSFTQLQDINFSHNRIKSIIFGDGECLPELITCNINHNRLENLSFLDAPLITKLNCLLIKYNRVKQLNTEAWRLPNLSELNLKGNLIRQPIRLQNFETLESLSLGSNMIQYLDLSRAIMPELKLLDLSHNRITEIILLNSRFDSLEQLNLDFNYLDRFQFTWITSPNLIKLSLNFNLIDRMNLIRVSLPAQCRIFASDNNMFKLKYDSLTKDSLLPQMLEPPLHEYYIKNLEGIINWYINRLTLQQLSEFMKSTGLIEMLPKWGYFIGHQIPPWMRYIYSDPEKNLYNYIKDLIPHNQF